MIHCGETSRGGSGITAKQVPPVVNTPNERPVVRQYPVGRCRPERIGWRPVRHKGSAPTSFRSGQHAGINGTRRRACPVYWSEYMSD